MKPIVNVHAHRDGRPSRDRAILDLIHLQQLGLAPGKVPTQLLRELWRVTQPNVCRRMQAIKDLGLYRQETYWGGYRLIELAEHKRARQLDQFERKEKWNSVRKRLQGMIK